MSTGQHEPCATRSDTEWMPPTRREILDYAILLALGAAGDDRDV